MEILDISGAWRYAEDENDTYVFKGEKLAREGFILPGSACDNKVGKKREYYDKISKEAVRALRERYEYIAPIYVQREIELPEGAENKCVRLFLERVNIASELWIDDKKTDRRIIELSTPHIYNLTGKITGGKHLLTLKIDNRNLLSLDNMASGYSVDTQGYWNGIIGRMEMQIEDIFHIENISVYPDDGGITVKITDTSDVHSPHLHKEAELCLEVMDKNGKSLGVKSCPISLFNSKQVDYVRYDMSDILYWDEFEPNMYTLNVTYICGEYTDKKSVVFGMRTVKSENKRLLINGRELSLRGTTDCAIYPITGYPPMDINVWRKNFKTIKSYGLNHVRFHAWCPPDCAFCAADELGVYLSVEMPMWLNRDVCALELGEDSIHRQYFMQEALNISKAYGNHPSFIMFSNGNENMGDFEILNDITTCIKAYDCRRLYTMTTNFDHPVMPCEDYLCAFEAYGSRVRIQTMHDAIAKNTALSYDEAVKKTPVPIISFEVGQYCVYPNVDSVEDFTGNMMAVNFDAIRKFMKEKGVYDRLADYVKASGDLAVKLYKEDFEAAMRTKGFGGIELLSLCDYTGQSTATVGILDVFYNSKGLISPDEFKRFAGEVVPLFKADRIFTNKDILNAELDLYDFGREKIENPVFEVEILNGGEEFLKLSTSERKFSTALDKIEKSAVLTVNVTVGGYTNSWRIFVFAEADADTEGRIIRTDEELSEILENGGRAVVAASCFTDSVQGSFVPVFWSPVHFPSRRPCGAIINNTHKALRGFPTDRYVDYQWKSLIDNSVGMRTGGFDGEVEMVVETVPNFFDNTVSSPLFTVKTDKAELLYCGFDIDADTPEARQLRASVLSWLCD